MIGSVGGRIRERSPRAYLIPALLSVIAGAAVAAGGKWMLAAAVIVALPVAALVVPRAIGRRTVREGFLAVELPLFFVLCSDLTFRIRTTDQLSANPFDAAGIVRAGFQGLALMFAVMALLSPSADTVDRPRFTTRPVRLYLLYVAVACVGIVMSGLPVLTAYRVFEVIVALAVFAGAYRVAGKEGLRRIERTLYWWVAATVGVIWLNVLASPGSALDHVYNSPVHWRIQSVVPAIASNTVGFLGVFLALFSMARLLRPHRSDYPRRAVLVAFTVAGIVTLLAAQYRTGYVAFAAGVVLLLIVRGRKSLALVVAVGVIFVALWGPTAGSSVEPFLSRGTKSSDLLQLNGRVDWWRLAVPVWKTSPIVGRGLLTGTRLALDTGGFGDTNTVHSTWVEALVDTGLVGIILLASTLLIALKRGFMEALRRGGDIAPLLVAIAIAVRSITGQTFDSFRLIMLLFLWAILSLRDDTDRQPSTG